MAFQTSKQTALQHFIDHCTAAELAQEGRARAFLAQFDLKGRTVDAMPIGKLSGGQRVKLLLAEVVCCGPHLLILDEVTSELRSRRRDGPNLTFDLCCTQHIWTANRSKR